MEEINNFQQEPDENLYQTWEQFKELLMKCPQHYIMEMQELRRNQDKDLMPTIEKGEVIEKFSTRNEDVDTGIDDYLSYCDYDKKIHIDYAHNLKFSCKIGFKFTHANFFTLLYVNVISKNFNSIMKDKMEYKGNNVVRTLIKVPISVGTFSAVTDFTVLENMDAYYDEGMGDVILGEPFLREVGIKARRFERMITLYKDDKSVNLPNGAITSKV
uniref:MAK10-like protein n=1 Tax=Tanacetum cinerariifolium TaxID=118510 RepID=A0A6L2JSY9_TANCI|nr:hypothetical protein [Tanacetum cinerariifolium]